MTRWFQITTALVLFFLPGCLVVALDGYSGFPIGRALFTDAIGVAETLVDDCLRRMLP